MKRKHGAHGHIGTMAMLATLIVSSTALMNTPTTPAAGRHTVAHTARSVNGTATAHLHLVRANGAELYEEGPVTGALQGSMKATFHTGASFTGSVTVHTRAGSIDGHGHATPHGSGRYQSFSGSFVVTGGSGRYNHASGKAGLYGVFDRRYDNLVVQTTGRFSY